MDNGFILLSRSIIESTVFQNEKWLKVWIWCLLEAGFHERIKQVKTGKGFTAVKIDRGQFIFGRNKHAKDLDIKPSTLWKIMLKLENFGNLNIKSDKHYSIVTVCNYEQYQDAENYKVTGKGTTKEQPSDRQGTHLKKERKKEGKNVKNTTIEKPENVTDQTWNDFVTHRKSKKSSVSQTVINTFTKEAEKAGMSLEDALKECMYRGWQGFKAEWVKNNQNKKHGNYTDDFWEEQFNGGNQTQPLITNQQPQRKTD